MQEAQMNTDILKLRDNIFLIPGEGKSSHTYLVRGQHGTVMIDSGLDSGFHLLQDKLHTLGLRVRDIDMIINTHEHFDHIGSNRYFQNHTIIAAHHLAANKMSYNDRYVTMYKSGDRNDSPMHVHLWLENRSRIDLGNYSLDIIHTPGHTSGSICIYETRDHLLFTGDTVFAGGTLSYIAESGSVGDYIHSIQNLSTLHIKEIYPGHGDISNQPESDIESALANARAFLSGDGYVSVTSWSDISSESNVQKTIL